MQELLERIWKDKYAFFGTFFIVFTITYLILMAVDLLPEPPASEAEVEILHLDEPNEDVVSEEVSEVLESETVNEAETSSVSAATSGEKVDAVLPLRIVIDRLDREVVVHNPTSRAVADLDEALLRGVVRHPDSATLDQDGNVFILGHSSYLPKVFNKNFQAFNGIQDLEWGDVIKLYADGVVYEYRVEKVYRAQAQDVTVPIANTGKMLTLATCNSFGSVDDRYIVEAKQIAVEDL